MMVEALIVMGFDSASEYALENLRKASEILRKEYGVRLVIVPFNTWNDSISSTLKSLPVIFIGGIKAFSGRIPSVKEVIDFVLNHVKHKHRRISEVLIPAATLGDDHISISAATV